MEEKWLAVFGDVHGRLRLMFQLCRLWQLHHNRHLDGILQCGDLGFFPEPGRLDRATGQFAEDDPEEVGFARFFHWSDPWEADPHLERWLLGPMDSLDTIRATAIWCHGNHEDFAALAQATGPDGGVVDYFDKLFYLPSGVVTDVAGLRVAAMGGGFEEEHRHDRGRGKGRHHAPSERFRWVDPSACDRLRTRGPFDILITHAAARSGPGEVWRSGSQESRRLLEDTQPRYHFFAHHRGPIPPHVIGRSQCFWLNDVTFTRRGSGHSAPLNPGCMGILRWRGAEDHEFTILNEPWLAGVNGSNWLDL